MRVVLLNEKRAERDAMLRALPSADYRVEAVADEAAGIASIARESPEVIVFSVPSKGGPDLVRRLRGADVSAQAYLIAVLDAAPSGKELTNLIGAGAHDFLRRPIVEAELLERVKAPRRLIRWALAVGKPSAFDLSAATDVTRLCAWKTLGAIVAEDFAQMAAQPLTVSQGWPKTFSGEVLVATIPMSLAGDQVELRVSIAVDSLSLTWLRTTLLGDPAADQAATDDALRELANTAGGAVKRAATSEHVTFTTGIPFNDPHCALPGEHACWTLALEGGNGCIGVAAEIRKHENQRVAAAALSEGMVVAHDVRNEAGILLVPAGARLTTTSAKRLAAMLGSKFFLEVAPAA